MLDARQEAVPILISHDSLSEDRCMEFIIIIIIALQNAQKRKENGAGSDS